MPLVRRRAAGRLALSPGAACVLARAVWPAGWPRIFALAIAMTAAEWLRGRLFTGFPWNVFGYALGLLAAADAGARRWSASGA